jgi:hypothetical protein
MTSVYPLNTRKLERIRILLPYIGNRYFTCPRQGDVATNLEEYAMSAGDMDTWPAVDVIVRDIDHAAIRLGISRPSASGSRTS